MATANLPLLRSPPFPGVDAAVSLGTRDVHAIAPQTIDRLLATMRDARVGGRFWDPPAIGNDAHVIVRARSPREFDSVAATVTRKAILAGNVDPWSLLQDDVQLIAHGDDEWVALAQIAGCAVRLLSDGRFGAVGDTAKHLRERAAQALSAARYRNPFTGENEDIDAAIAHLGQWRRVFEANTGIVAACGMAWWKRYEIARFLWTPTQTLRFFWSERRAIGYANQHNGALAIWPSRISPRLIERARDHGVALIRVEDGFVRSVGLGSNLVPPSSVAVDRLGIHYDPSQPSDLEQLLANASFSPGQLTRAQKLRRTILNAGISKYGSGDETVIPIRQSERRLVLVTGQVEDDMSVRLGGAGLSSNLELLRRARALEADAEIWFRPHPDVDAGHRLGAVPDADALIHADRVVRGGGMAPLLDQVDAVHVLTSLAGFEALLRGRTVTCHGVPFYAGWGLTRDLAAVPHRRGRQLTLDQLVAAVLILYPRYLDPVTGLPCPPEMLIRRMSEGTARNRLGSISRLRQLQGCLTGLISRRRGRA
jgi:capsular polysaccharide export protein